MNYKQMKEFENSSFNIGGGEETIGFISDNYYEAISIYRTIVKRVEETEKIRDLANDDLEKLREKKDKWDKLEMKITKSTDERQIKKLKTQRPPEEEKREHAKLMEYYIKVREMDYDVIWKGKPLQHNTLTNMIINHMPLFKALAAIDMRGRKIVSPIIFTFLKAALFPTKWTMKSCIKHTKSKKYKNGLKKNVKHMNTWPEILKKRILNPS